MKNTEINIRDPFVLVYNKKYYMYGSRVENQKGFDVYISEDLENWEAPKSVFEYKHGFWGTNDFWAPEVHFYNGKFYMFATFRGDKTHRGTQVLVCDTPDGEFKEHSKGALTPAEWDCLDGSLYVENGKPYMIFCHEWQQIRNGEMWCVELTKDLKETAEEPTLMFTAYDPVWSRYKTEGNPDCVTDGPFIYKNALGELCMLWATLKADKYVQVVSKSSNGTIKGIWNKHNIIYDDDGGHAMFFKTVEGKNMFVLHSPNQYMCERPCFFEIDEDSEGNIKLK